MSVIYLPAVASSGLTSAQVADKMSEELWRLQRPSSIQSSKDTRYLYPRVVHPVTKQVALIADSEDLIKVHADADSTNLLSSFSEASKSEKATMDSYIQSNLDGKITLGSLIPSSSTQLTESEADAAGWIPDSEVP